MQNTLSNNETHFLINVINKGVSQGAQNLNKVLNQAIYLHPISLHFGESNEFFNALKDDEENHCFVKMAFNGANQGEVLFCFPISVASQLLEATLAMTIEESDPLFKESIIELGNIVVNSVIGSQANIFRQDIQYRPPIYLEGQLNEVLNVTSDSYLMSFETQFDVKGTCCYGRILFICEDSSLIALKNRLRSL